MSEFVDPDKVHLGDLRKPIIHEDTEAELIQVDPNTWTPIILQGTRVIDGMQRVLVARKHGIPAIPFTRMK